MAKLKNPLLSLKASGSLARAISFCRRRGMSLVEKRPVPVDAQTAPQLSWRHMFTKCVDLWHLLSAAEKQEWESAARSRHMTGYAWYISRCLRPNPGIYLPLQGGTMSGDIDMAKNRVLKLPAPTDSQEPARKAELDALVGGYTEGARVYHDANQSIPNNSTTFLAFNQERYDTDTVHDPVTNNSRLTCKTAGKYMIAANVAWAADAVGFRQVLILLNAATIIAIVTDDATATDTSRQPLATIYDLALNDFVEVFVKQTSGGALNIMVAQNFSPEFMMQRIG